ncbi:MAG: hypothetical protein AAF449_21375, partial [Myxococcota bacterium]
MSIQLSGFRPKPQGEHTELSRAKLQNNSPASPTVETANIQEVEGNIDPSEAPLVAFLDRQTIQDAARRAESERISPKTTRVRHSTITIDVNELNAFKNGVKHDEIPSMLRRATEEKANEDTVAYSDSIAKYIHRNGSGAFDRALEVYNRDFGARLSPDITPGKKTGRFADRAMLKERKKLVADSGVAWVEAKARPREDAAVVHLG